MIIACGLAISCVKAKPEEVKPRDVKIVNSKPQLRSFENFDFGLFFTLLTPAEVIQDQIGTPDKLEYKNKGTKDEKVIWIYKVQNGIDWSFVINRQNNLLYGFEITPKPPRRVKEPLIYPGKLISKSDNDDIHATYGEPVDYGERKDKSGCFFSEYQFDMKSYDKYLKCFVFIDYDPDYKIEKVYVGVKKVIDRSRQKNSEEAG